MPQGQRSMNPRRRSRRGSRRAQRHPRCRRDARPRRAQSRDSGDGEAGECRDRAQDRFQVLRVAARSRRAASAAPPSAKTHSVTAGISQSQSMPAWISHTITAARAAAYRRAGRSARAAREPVDDRAEHDQQQREPNHTELAEHLHIQRVSVADVERDRALARPQVLVGAGTLARERARRQRRQSPHPTGRDGRCWPGR